MKFVNFHESWFYQLIMLYKITWLDALKVEQNQEYETENSPAIWHSGKGKIQEVRRQELCYNKKGDYTEDNWINYWRKKRG